LQDKSNYVIIELIIILDRKIKETRHMEINISNVMELFRAEYAEIQSILGEHEEFKPAEQSAVSEFAENSRKRNIPECVTRQLTEFYEIADALFVDGVEIHSCDDEILFEWWDEDGELWLGGSDSDVFRWSGEKGKFCMGDASDVSYGEDHEFDTFAELLKFVYDYYFDECEADTELKFADLNFKLAVIQVLMYEKGLLTPKFDAWDFADSYTERKIDIEEEGYEPIEEIRQYFMDLKIDRKYAAEVTELDLDGGNEVYRQIWVFWDGEDEYYDVESLDLEELAQFPNLKTVTGSADFFCNVHEVLEEYGVDISAFGDGYKWSPSDDEDEDECETSQVEWETSADPQIIALKQAFMNAGYDVSECVNTNGTYLTITSDTGVFAFMGKGDSQFVALMSESYKTAATAYNMEIVVRDNWFWFGSPGMIEIIERVLCG
jgi:hypothetical protein